MLDPAWPRPSVQPTPIPKTILCARNGERLDDVALAWFGCVADALAAALI